MVVELFRISFYEQNFFSFFFLPRERKDLFQEFYAFDIVCNSVDVGLGEGGVH
jgi:hypothetical protein